MDGFCIAGIARKQLLGPCKSHSLIYEFLPATPPFAAFLYTRDNFRPTVIFGEIIIAIMTLLQFYPIIVLLHFVVPEIKIIDDGRSEIAEVPNFIPQWL